MNMKVHMQMMVVTLLVAGALFSPRMTNAALTPTTADARAAVVRNWLQYSRDQQWSSSLDAATPTMQELFHEGQLVGYVASQTQGYIVLPAYSELPPITAYSGGSQFNINDEGGFVQFLKEELAQKIAVARDVSEATQVLPAMEAARAQVNKDRQLWQSYSANYAEFLRAAAAETAASSLDEVASVEPLLQSTWHQGAPFNAFCPLGSGGRCVVGCVGTAAAQIVNFWRYPVNGTGSNSYTWNGDNSCGATVGGGVLTADFSDTYDWANMLNRYTGTETQAQKDAAAELCYEMGVAVNMDFGRCGSGASLQATVNAFRDHFGMSTDIDVEARSAYSTADSWFAMLQQELNSGHPMFYVIALHAIVCDGWRTSAGNQLHFNYGWSDTHTAWYTVDNLYCAWTGCNPMVEQTVRNIHPAGAAAPASITVSSPNGGESWNIGSGVTVTWTSANLSENVNVQLNRSYPAGAWETIGAAVANNGSYAYTVSGAASTTARVRVVGAVSATVGDTSNANFTIASTPPPPVPSITVTSPNGGETWTVGQNAIVSWTSANLTGNVNVELNRAYPGGAWETIIASTPNDGVQPYLVSGVVSSAARVRVVSAVTATVGDTSNASFTITSAPPPPVPTITVAAPNGGETWTIGQNAIINWTSANFTGNVNVELNRAYPGGAWETVVAATANDGAHTFLVSGTASTTARVRVRDAATTAVGDTSNAAFIIISPAPVASVTVTAPNGGETWTIGLNATVSWTSVNLSGSVKLELNRAYPGGTWEPIVSSTTNDGSHTFLLNGAASTTARVRVMSVLTPSVGDTSNANFTIAAPAPLTRRIVVTAPNGGESWASGLSATARWTSLNVTGSVKIELNRAYPGGVWETIIASTTNDGVHLFSLTGAASTTARLRIRSVTYTTVGDTSDADFTITAPPIQNLPLVYPNGSENLNLGSSTVVRWTPNGVAGYVKIQVNRNYPAGTWESIAGMTANDGSYTWRVTGATSVRSRIRVMSVSNAAVGDTSDSDFRISGALNIGGDEPLATKFGGASPNPFNPTTSLRYQLSEAVEVHLDVFDVTGRLVASLANGIQPAGEHVAHFDGAALGSGLYFVRFHAGEVNSVQRLQLLK